MELLRLLHCRALRARRLEPRFRIGGEQRDLSPLRSRAALGADDPRGPPFQVRRGLAPHVVVFDGVLHVFVLELRLVVLCVLPLQPRDRPGRGNLHRDGGDLNRHRRGTRKVNSFFRDGQPHDAHILQGDLRRRELVDLFRSPREHERIHRCVVPFRRRLHTNRLIEHYDRCLRRERDEACAAGPQHLGARTASLRDVRGRRLAQHPQQGGP
mmetsp:Transcript_55595/g.155990  ORF Transcript_55595/g.155990 Transcript_55595/m.155990 type:complete len:212 (-) Transcript_55595:106-741(-)